MSVAPDVDVDRLLHLHQVPGAAAAVMEGGTVEVAAWGVAERGASARVTPATVFSAQSLTKPVVAYLVLLLVQDGAVDLDEPVAALLERDGAGGSGAGITPRRLLSHTAGLARWGNLAEPIVPLDPPGARFRYSGYGYRLLQAAVEHHTGRSLPDLLDERVFAPLGMATTTVAGPDRGWSSARGHDADGNPMPRQSWSEAHAATSMATTVEDAARFLGAMLGTVPGPLAAAGRAAMLRPEVHIGTELAWGLGWGLDTAAPPAFWQWGSGPEFQHLAIGVPADGRAAVVLTNGAGGRNVYTPILRSCLGDRAALRVEHDPDWVAASID